METISSEKMQVLLQKNIFCYLTAVLQECGGSITITSEQLGRFSDATIHVIPNDIGYMLSVTYKDAKKEGEV